MARSIMIQGTMSNAGKSLIAAGLCRIFAQDGYKTAPFKSQNMALNSFITEDGLEMGRAQVVQAEAAGVKPSADMNPILLKPTTDVGSQVIVNGVSIGNMRAKDYFAYKKQLIPQIMEAYKRLDEAYDVIVIEGAGSPAEINLKSDDIVNMGLAAMVDAPVLLAGDIDRGGVFAQLYGTVELLEPEERNRIKGLIINKFRGDKSILEPGLRQLEDLCKIPVAGVVPYMNVDIEDEDSLSSKLGNTRQKGYIDIAVIRFPKISNFTDMDVFERMDEVSIRYVSKPSELKTPDMVILPGTKNTIDDLLWMRQNGLEAAILKLAARQVPVWGICGGFQMMGEWLVDEHAIESSHKGKIHGMGLFPVETEFEEEKVRTQTEGRFGELYGCFRELSGKRLTGYEIHMGRTKSREKEQPLCLLNAGESANGREARGIPCGWNRKNLYGSYVHGVFDAPGICETIATALAARKGITLEMAGQMDYIAYKEEQYDKLAEILRESLDMEKIYEIMGLEEKVHIEQVLPADIEHRSFEIIGEELKAMGKELEPEQAPVIMRAIHTTADFDYADHLKFSENAVEKAREAIKKGAVIITDTKMGWSGVNKKRLESYGGEALCFMADEDVAAEAKKNGSTRAVASMDKAANLFGDGTRPCIFAIGNAPTALIRLYELIQERKIKPALIIGAPVGFVNVIQSKELILSLKDTPYIVAEGRKGGSNVAAAICNALLYGIK